MRWYSPTKAWAGSSTARAGGQAAGARRAPLAAGAERDQQREDHDHEDRGDDDVPVGDRPPVADAADVLAAGVRPGRGRERPRGTRANPATTESSASGTTKRGRQLVWWAGQGQAWAHSHGGQRRGPRWPPGSGSSRGTGSGRSAPSARRAAPGPASPAATPSASRRASAVAEPAGRDVGHDRGADPDRGDHPVRELDQRVAHRRRTGRPWQPGQSGQPRPEPVNRTNAPEAMFSHIVNARNAANWPNPRRVCGRSLDSARRTGGRAAVAGGPSRSSVRAGQRRRARRRRAQRPPAACRHVPQRQREAAHALVGLVGVDRREREAQVARRHARRDVGRAGRDDDAALGGAGEDLELGRAVGQPQPEVVAAARLDPGRAAARGGGLERRRRRRPCAPRRRRAHALEVAPRRAPRSGSAPAAGPAAGSCSGRRRAWWPGAARSSAGGDEQRAEREARAAPSWRTSATTRTGAPAS